MLSARWLTRMAPVMYTVASLLLVSVLSGCGGNKTGFYDAKDTPVPPPDRPPEEGSLSTSDEEADVMDWDDGLDDAEMMGAETDSVVPASLTPEELPSPEASSSVSVQTKSPVAVKASSGNKPPAEATVSDDAMSADDSDALDAGAESSHVSSSPVNVTVKPVVKPKGELPKGSVKVTTQRTSSTTAAPEPDTMTFSATKKSPPTEPAL